MSLEISFPRDDYLKFNTVNSSQFVKGAQSSMPGRPIKSSGVYPVSTAYYRLSTTAPPNLSSARNQSLNDVQRGIGQKNEHRN